ncbi:MAG: hypothetical protein WCP55_14110 [Lentisphaerota bacterium]
MKPDFVTHYHLSNRQPFLSLSDLDCDIEHHVFIEMLNKHKEDVNYRRRYGKNYLKVRRDCESKLRTLFQARGGSPRRNYPLYLVLGESDWFRKLNVAHAEVRIALSELSAETTSITFPDSFLAMNAKDKPYYEKVFLLSEIDEVLKRFGYPKAPIPNSYERYWEGDFEHYIEVQIWDDEIVEPYRKQWKRQQKDRPNR